MHAYIMPPSLNQPVMRLWIGHILDIVLLVFIVKSRSSFLPCLRNTLFSSLPIFSLGIAFRACVLLAPVCHFISFKSSFESVPRVHIRVAATAAFIAAGRYSTITLNPHTPNQFLPSKNGRSRHHW